MNSSFFKYRDKSGLQNIDDNDSETEVIDNSLDSEESFKMLKRTPFKTPLKNRTLFIAESDESVGDDEFEDETRVSPKQTKSTIRRSSVAETHINGSSDDDADKQGSIRRQSKKFDSVVITSSDEEELSPELVPRRRPPITPCSNDTADSPLIRRKVNKRMFLVDSDADNSIVVAHDKNNKMSCIKDTPLKLDGHTDKHKPDESMVHDDKDETNESNNENSDVDSSDENELNKTDSKKPVSGSNVVESGSDDAGSGSDDTESGSDGNEVDDDDEPDEDQMVMSRATRMSIMGVIPKEHESDESDFIESDESDIKFREGSLNTAAPLNTYTELPDHGISIKTPPENLPIDDTSRISCSPFSSPLHDITNEPKLRNEADIKNKSIHASNDNETKSLKDKVLNNLLVEDTKTGENKENAQVQYDDDDVPTIIENEPEIIALSSDDDEIQAPKRSPKSKKSPISKNEELSTSKTGSKSNDMKQYLPPPSRPNSYIVYVKSHVREKELTKLNSLRADLQQVRYILETANITTLPDNGAKLIQRLTELEEKVRDQGNKVANMVVEPEEPTAEQIARDNYNSKMNAGLSWEEIQKASNAVQPRLFGKQAMSTHMAERNLILERLKDLHESLASRPSESQQGKQPSSVKSTLMPHQLHALAWLKWRETQRPSGGILADDMGLGKTITMIALVASDRENRIDDDDDDSDSEGRPSSKLVRGGTLVVCPASLIQQWGGEVSRHCTSGALSVCLHHGAGRATHPHRLTTNDIVITTYNILQRDNEKKGVLMRVRWRRVILDEAHIVRNHKSATSGGVCALAARRRWCLTGTPVQNKDIDLFALLKFLRCTPFDELPMWKKWIDNRSQGGQERLNTIMQCILLRRTKLQLQQCGQLACLPERTAYHRLVTLSANEMAVYRKVLVFSKTLFAQFLHQRAEKQAGSELTPTKNSAYDKMHKRMIALQGAKPVKSHEILVLLLRLRQVCCHCGLIAAMLDDEDRGAVDEDPGSKDLLADLEKLSLEESKHKTENKNKDDSEDDEVREEGTTVTEAIRSVLSPNNPVFDLKRISSKIKSVMDCLNENVFSNKGDKAVIVSQWTSVLRLVEQELKKTGVRSVTLNGQVPALARPAIVDALNNPHNDVKVMLLSLSAGGVGLNLKGANHLLLLDPHWNPQLEEQAQDRIYRIGQNKPVHIYRFMCVDTVEQTIRKLQEAKLALAENVLTGAKNTNNSNLTIEDLKMLFNMGAPNQ